MGDNGYRKPVETNVEQGLVLGSVILRIFHGCALVGLSALEAEGANLLSVPQPRTRNPHASEGLRGS